MNKVQADRMAAMVGILEKLGRDVFDQNHWTSRAGGPVLDGNDVPKCGTSACFAGWTAAAFPRSWTWYGGEAPLLAKHLALSYSVTTADSISSFFGITLDEAIELVRPIRPIRITPKAKARELRALMATYGWRVE